MSANRSRPCSRAIVANAANAVVVVLAMNCGLSAACAGVVVFSQDLSGFNAAAGDPPIAVDFDSIAAGTDIGGQSIGGATFTATGSPLIVVEGADTQTSGAYSGVLDANTNKLFPTSGANVLSPGGGVLSPGPDPAVENDGVNIVFDNPISAFGFDHLSQSADGFSFSNIQVFDAADAPLFSGSIPISNVGNLGGGAPGGADFWGIVSDAAVIKRVLITEGDGDASFPDNNIGFDTLRFGIAGPPPPPPTGIPLPAALYTAPLMFGAAAWARRKLRV